MDTVKKEENSCEEETLQTAFKKLRVDAESSVAAVHVSEALASRAGTRVNTDGVKPKITSPKENWHGCNRKSTRGLTRNQRRRRSKSPILHPPKFTYCSSKMQFNHKSPAKLEDTSTSLVVPAKKELLYSSSSPSPIFGSMVYDSNNALKSKISPLNHVAPFGTESSSKGNDEKSNTSEKTEAPAADFESLCQLQESGVCQCTNWQGMEVYSFTGLRDVISECEKKLPTSSDAAQNRTVNASSLSSSPLSCSEQARVYVDDITIEDLSGYMEFYLYIPKKMSHMAEMMYT